MLKDITLGQFFPGKTVIHRLDPRTKLLMTVLYLVALFVANSWVSYGLVLAFLITAVSLSRIRPPWTFRLQAGGWHRNAFGSMPTDPDTSPSLHRW